MPILREQVAEVRRERYAREQRTVECRVRTVVDTNVLVSGVISRGAPHQVLLAWLRGAFQLVASQALYDEIEAVLGRPRIRERYRIGEAEVALLLQRPRRMH